MPVLGTDSSAGSEYVGLPKPQTPMTLPNHPTRDRFVLMHHPNCWDADVVAGRLLPELSPISQGEGVFGATLNRPNEPIRQLEAQGFALIPTDAAQAVGHSSYLRRTRVRGGYHYHTAWEALVPGTGYTAFDAEGYRAFRAALLDEGIVGPPPAHVVQTQVNALNLQLRALERAVAKNQAAQSDVDELAARIEVWEAALAPAPSPSTSKSRGRRKASGEES